MIAKSPHAQHHPAASLSCLGTGSIRNRWASTFSLDLVSLLQEEVGGERKGSGMQAVFETASIASRRGFWFALLCAAPCVRAKTHPC